MHRLPKNNLVCVYYDPQVLAAIRKGTVCNPDDEDLVVKREQTAKELTTILKFDADAAKTAFILTGAEVFMVCGVAC